MKKIIFSLMLSFLFTGYLDAQSTMEPVSKEKMPRIGDEINLDKRKNTFAKLRNIGATQVMIERINELFDRESELEMKIENADLKKDEAVKMRKELAVENENNLKEILGLDLYNKFKAPSTKNSQAAPEKQLMIKKVTVKKKKA